MSHDHLPLRITLVHGTWARLTLPSPSRSGKRAPFWFEEESSFSGVLCSRLKQKGFSAFVTPFHWSGANSIMHRDQGAEALSKHLHDERQLFPMSLQVVIAHSHGGNLALRALARLGDSTPTLPFLVTLATPFVSVLPVDADRKRTARTENVLLGGWFVFLLLPLLWILYRDAQANEPWPSSPFVAAYWLTAAFLAGAWVSVVKHFGEQKILKLVAATSTNSLNESAKLLVLRTFDDEASLTLAAGAIGNRLARVMFFILTNLLYFSFFAAFLFPLAALLILVSADFRIPDWSFLLIPMSFLIIPLICLVLMGLAGLCRCVYGRELAVVVADCVINSHSVPDKLAGDLTVVTLSESFEPRRLRHKIYDNWQCAMVIAEWLDKQALGVKGLGLSAQSSAFIRL